MKTISVIKVLPFLMLASLAVSSCSRTQSSEVSNEEESTSYALKKKLEGSNIEVQIERESNSTRAFAKEILANLNRMLAISNSFTKDFPLKIPVESFLEDGERFCKYVRKFIIEIGDGYDLKVTRSIRVHAYFQNNIKEEVPAIYHDIITITIPKELSYKIKDLEKSTLVDRILVMSEAFTALKMPEDAKEIIETIGKEYTASFSFLNESFLIPMTDFNELITYMKNDVGVSRMFGNADDAIMLSNNDSSNIIGGLRMKFIDVTNGNPTAKLKAYLAE